MELKKIIVKLIVQDMKNHQLLKGMELLGFSNCEGEHSTSISDVVGRLMGIAENTVTDEWLDTYFDFVFQAHRYKITTLGQNLYPLADACYDALLRRTKQDVEKSLHNLQITATGIVRKGSGYGSLLARFIAEIATETEQFADGIDKCKKAGKSKLIAADEAMRIIKQFHAFVEDLIKLPADKLQQKYDLK